MPLRFEIVYSLYLALKNQIEEENKEREKQEKEAQGGNEIPTVNGLTNQASSMINNVKMPSYNIPNMGSISIPH